MITVTPKTTVSVTLVGVSTGTVAVQSPTGSAGVTLTQFFKGDPGADGQTLVYQHTQSAPSDTWIVPHNMGVRPNISVYTPGWVEVEALVVHVDNNNAQVQFASAQAGFATCK